MADHQMIYSPKRKNKKKQWSHEEYYESLLMIIQLSIVTIFSLCWLLILLYHVRNGFASISSHVFPISAGFQLSLFSRVKRAGPLNPLLSEDWFQEALDPCNVRHNTVELLFPVLM
jgi:hypothetical protein